MEPELGKLRWRCRRGMKELDLLLTRFVDEDYPDAPPGVREAFGQLLDLQDPVIYDHVLGRTIPSDPALHALIGRITAKHSNDP